MTELINKLISEAGLSPEQANKTITVIKGFVTEKFPMLAGAVENVLGVSSSDAGGEKSEGGILDKISDIIPGEVGEKIEGFAKQAANKFQDLEGKL